MNMPLKLDMISDEYKFVRILPEQISETWVFIVPFIERALMTSSDETNLVLVFNSLVSGVLEAWVLVKKGEDKNWLDGETAAVVTGQVTVDPNTGARNLFIYSMAGEGYLTTEIWSDMMIAAANYARASNCTSIVSVSKNERVIRAFKKAGAEVESRYMTLKVGV